MGATIIKPLHGSMEWLKLRHRDDTGWPVVSASDAAAVHGEHRFKTKYGLGIDKLADEPTVTETNRAMERGNRLEATLLNWVGDEIGERVFNPDRMYVFQERGASMVATLDGYIGNNPFLPDAIVEIKTYSGVFDPDGDYGDGYGPLPAYWHWQGVQQSLCCDTDEVIWGVFDSTLDLKIYRQYVTEVDRGRHIAAVADFCRNIAVGFLPDDWQANYNDFASKPVSEHVADLTDLSSVIAQLREVQAEKRELNDREDELKASLAAAMDGATVGTVDGQEVVTWKQQSRISFDAKRFASEHPDLHKQYQTSSTFRVMRTKGTK
jgi:predicted phage-related endonuclease